MDEGGICRVKSYGCPCVYPPFIVDYGDLGNIDGKDGPEEPFKYAAWNNSRYSANIMLCPVRED